MEIIILGLLALFAIPFIGPIIFWVYVGHAAGFSEDTIGTLVAVSYPFLDMVDGEMETVNG